MHYILQLKNYNIELSLIFKTKAPQPSAGVLRKQLYRKTLDMLQFNI